MRKSYKTWEHEFFAEFTKWLKLDKKHAQPLEPLLDLEMEPNGFLESLDWPEDDFIRIPLLVLLFAIYKKGEYEARARVLVRRLCKTLQSVNWVDWKSQEFLYGKIMWEELEKKDAKAKKGKLGKWLKIGGVGLVSGLAIGLTAGLAAPAIGAGLAAIGLSGGAAFILTVTGAATLGSLFGVGGAGYVGYKMNNRVGDLKTFEFQRLEQAKAGLNVIIAVAGWLPDEETRVEDVWGTIPELAEFADCYAVEYDPDVLRSVGRGITKFATDYAISSVKNKAGLLATQALVAGAAVLFAALTWPVTIIAAADVIDNPWSVAMSKSKECGLVLADALANKNGGGRPVTLVGFSLGARAIFYAIKDLERRKKAGEPYVEIENAFLISAPVEGAPKSWASMRDIVRGRLVNAYSNSDWVLKFVYRTTQTRISVAGIQKVDEGNKLVEDIDISPLIDGHQDIERKLPLILQMIGIDDLEQPDIGLLGGEFEETKDSERPASAPTAEGPLETTEKKPTLPASKSEELPRRGLEVDKPAKDAVGTEEKRSKSPIDLE